MRSIGQPNRIHNTGHPTVTVSGTISGAGKDRRPLFTSGAEFTTDPIRATSTMFAIFHVSLRLTVGRSGAVRAWPYKKWVRSPAPGRVAIHRTLRWNSLAPPATFLEHDSARQTVGFQSPVIVLQLRFMRYCSRMGPQILVLNRLPALCRGFLCRGFLLLVSPRWRPCPLRAGLRARATGRRSRPPVHAAAHRGPTL
jgi:hypothetical protein